MIRFYLQNIRIEGNTHYCVRYSIVSLQSSLKRGGGSPDSSEGYKWEVEQKFAHHQECLWWIIKVQHFRAPNVARQ